MTSVRCVAVIVLCAGLSAMAPAFATDQAAVPGSAPLPGHQQLDPAMALRLKRLETELRCLVCQNQTLADSEAGLAQDLRNQVELLALQGKSDAEIKTWLQDRYGDFVLYRPPVKPMTWLLWFGPITLLLLLLVFWGWRLRRSQLAAPLVAGAADESLDAVLEEAMHRT